MAASAPMSRRNFLLGAAAVAGFLATGPPPGKGRGHRTTSSTTSTTTTTVALTGYGSGSYGANTYGN